MTNRWIYTPEEEALRRQEDEGRRQEVSP